MSDKGQITLDCSNEDLKEVMRRVQDEFQLKAEQFEEVLTVTMDMVLACSEELSVMDVAVFARRYSMRVINRRSA